MIRGRKGVEAAISEIVEMAEAIPEVEDKDVDALAYAILEWGLDLAEYFSYGEDDEPKYVKFTKVLNKSAPKKGTKAGAI